MKKLIRLLAIFTVLAGFIFTQLGQVSGQSNALAIQPRKDYNLKAGESVRDNLTVTNRNEEQPLNLELTVVDFQAQDESGAPLLMRDSTERTAWSLKNFIDIPQQITINPGETVRIPITIAVPEDVGAGSYYSAIEYSAISPESGDQVNISASGVSLVFVKVPGQAKQQLTFLQFGAFVPDSSGSNGSFKGLYFGERPKVLAYRLKNEGNVAEQPSASILVKNFSGDIVYEIKDANPKDQLALRGQTRRFDACINPEDINRTTETGQDIESIVCGDTEKFTPGRYTAELSVVYGENGNETREITAKATFWYLPWWFVGVVLVALGILIGAVVYVLRRVKSFRGRKTRRR
jgi:hypothetical protein